MIEMSWEKIVKRNNTDPRGYTFDVLLSVTVDDLDEEIADFHMEQGSEIMRNLHEAIIDVVRKKIDGESFDFNVDISEIESDMEELEMEGFNTLDNRVSASVSEVSMTSRDSRYPSY